MSKALTVREMQKYLENGGAYKREDLVFRIKVLDVRSANAEGIEFLITPVMGTGQAWVSAALITLDPMDPITEGGGNK